ncbi:MAG: right-handed parallel beta-helix repeat-containing protein [Polyangiales bacterium]
MRVSLCIVFFLVACGDVVPCTSAELVEALGNASNGDVVTLAACEFQDVQATVPAGVSLVGVAGSRIAGSGDVLVLEAGASLSNVEVTVSNGRGVVLSPGMHSLSAVNVNVDGGVGISAVGAEGTWSNVRVEGALDPLRADAIPPLAAPEDGHFLVVLEDVTIDFIDVGVLQGGPWGVIVQNSTLHWDEGFVRDVVGTGVYASGSTLTMTDVSIENMLQGIQPYPSYGILATETNFTSDGVEIRGSEGLGLLADDSSGVQSDLLVESCSFGGAWIQRTSEMQFDRISMMDNGLAGLVSQSSTLTINEGLITGTTLQQALHAGDRSVTTGDGVQINDPLGVTIEGLSLTGNERVGLVVDLASQPIANVQVRSLSVEGESLGALVQQDGTVARGWDAAVTRDATTQTNDTAQSLPLDLVGSLLEDSIPSADR